MLQRFLQFSCDVCGESGDMSPEDSSLREWCAYLRTVGWRFRKQKAICGCCWSRGYRWVAATLFETNNDFPYEVS